MDVIGPVAIAILMGLSAWAGWAGGARKVRNDVIMRLDALIRVEGLTRDLITGEQRANGTIENLKQVRKEIDPKPWYAIHDRSRW